MDSMNHHHNSARAFDENQRRQIWSDHISAPSSLVSRVLAHVELGQEQGMSTNVDQLVAALRHPEWSVRVAAVQALARLGERAPREWFQGALHDEHVSVRAAAVSALGQLKMYSSIPMLERFLHDSEWQVREKAALALAALGAQSSITTLRAALYDPDNTVRESVSYALQQLQASVPFHAEEILPGAQEIHKTSDSIPVRTNNTKNFLARLEFPFSRKQQSSGVNNMLKTPLKLVDEDPAVSRVPAQDARRVAGRRQHAFSNAVVLLAVLALVVLSAIIIPLYRLSGIATGHHPIVTPKPTIPPTVTPTATPLGSAGTILYTYQSTYQLVSSVAWSPDDKRLVMADNTVQSWDATTGKNVITYANQMNGDVTSVAWSPDGKYIAGSGPQVQLWDAASGQPLGSYQPVSQANVSATSNDQVYDSEWSPDSKLIASAANGQAYGFTIQVWNPQTRQMVFSIPSNINGFINEVRWSPDGKYLAFSGNGQVQVYNVATRALIIQHSGGDAFAWSQDGTKIASTDDRHAQIQVWDVATGNTLTSFQDQDTAYGSVGSKALAWSPDGQYVAVVAGIITEWKISTGSKVLEYKAFADSNQGFNPGNYAQSLAWSHDGRMIAFSSGGEVGPGAVHVWVPVS